ncbi:hypothetical protein BU26DRAFT_513040 [Trematosphaeria pertusa]|uniref:Uncharacterized protein n=1 Tax=Trematosphaeria pertusa TaxID=390896 RepID=A0A6A6J0P4_9PLEO|nr:uncharacterized protein BU26DRAFT_513040 [Trematosphaeria pertusa]KAF2256196.1 hypothetical protein BU26DRAFT_513040 [Trematosphaeria pertusa]
MHLGRSRRRQLDRSGSGRVRTIYTALRRNDTSQKGALSNPRERGRKPKALQNLIPFHWKVTSIDVTANKNGKRSRQTPRHPLGFRCRNAPSSLDTVRLSDLEIRHGFRHSPLRESTGLLDHLPLLTARLDTAMKRSPGTWKDWIRFKPGKTDFLAELAAPLEDNLFEYPSSTRLSIGVLYITNDDLRAQISALLDIRQ